MINYSLNPWMFPWGIVPQMPRQNEKPPTLYALLNSKVNFGNDNPVSIVNLTSAGRQYVFDFEYPLATEVNKEDFEIMILNHFLMRRIGTETFTAFKILLNAKLNEIMPTYNVLLKSLDGWDLLNDGETITHELESSLTKSSTEQTQNNGTGSTTTQTTDDLRNSITPQNELEDVQDGSYVTNYNLNTGNGVGSTTTSNTENKTGSGNNSITLSETTVHTPADKVEKYKRFLEDKQSIYTLILKDLDCLFYQIIDGGL